MAELTLSQTESRSTADKIPVYARVPVILGVMLVLMAVAVRIHWAFLPTPNWAQFGVLIALLVVSALAIAFLPARVDQALMARARSLLTDERRLLIALAIAYLAIGIPSVLGLRPWADEVDSLKGVQVLLDKGFTSFFADYHRIPWLGNQHPPLPFLLYAGVMQVFGVSYAALRITNLALGFGAVWLAYLLGRDLFDRRIGATAASVMLTIPLFIRLSAMGTNDLPLLVFLLLALHLNHRLIRRSSYATALGVGAAIGLAMLSKYTAILIGPVLLAQIVIFGSIPKLWKHLIVVGLSALLVFSPWLLYGLMSGVYASQSQTMVRYVGLARPEEYSFSAYVRWRLIKMVEWMIKELPYGFGVYHVPALFAGIVAVTRRWNRSALFVALWIAAFVVPVLSTLPQPRYLLPAFPAVAMMIAFGYIYLVSRTRSGLALQSPVRVLLLAFVYGAVRVYLYTGVERSAELIMP